MFRIVLFLLALGAGSGAAWLALAMQPGNDAPAAAIAEPAPQVEMPEVLVASADLVQGRALGEEALRWQPWPEAAILPGFITRTEQSDATDTLKDAIVRSHILAGEPIREDKLVRADSGFLSAILPSGKRAVAVRITAENTAGGFILPNDRVDVLHTQSREGESSGSVSRTILANIRVLAIDQKADDTSAEASTIGKTATLELLPEQAETVAAAEASGVLSLALRSVADADESPQEARPTARTVRVIRAGRTELLRIE
ncbi:MAG TPA: Flp pilus assembly protein CpaB [Afifellaceae bacterium]|nr:Flp pilus assembly protein CpaB [Afifellaceae bacterium]